MTAYKKSSLKTKKINDPPGSQKASALRGIDAVDKLLSWIFVLAVGLLPLLVRVKLIQFISPKIINDMVDSGIQTDIFSYYKWIFLLIITATAVALLLFKMAAYRYELKSSYINPLLLILAALTVLSAALSEFPGISMIGMYNRHEGAFTYLCYFALVFVALNTNFIKSIGRNIMLAFYLLVSINLIIIMFSFYEKDLLSYGAIKAIIVPAYLSQTGLQGNLNSTLSNINYVSGFSASMMAFFMSYALLEKSFHYRLISALFAVLTFAMLLASLSASGFLTILIMVPIIFALSLISRTYIKSLITGVAVLAACAGMFLFLSNHNPRVWDESVGSLRGVLKDFSISTGLTKERLSSLVLPKAAVAAPVGPSEVITPGAPAAAGDQFNLPKPSFGPGTGRLYIWQKTMGLIVKKPLLGYGHDTLTYYFPQNDKYKISNLNSYDEIVTKPHNVYLDMAYGSGIMALLAFAALMLLHLYDTARRLIKSFGSQTVVLQGAIFSFLCAFLIQWLFNDSVIGTSVIFWTLLGVSASINHEAC